MAFGFWPSAFACADPTDRPFSERVLSAAWSSKSPESKAQSLSGGHHG